MRTTYRSIHCLSETTIHTSKKKRRIQWKKLSLLLTLVIVLFITCDTIVQAWSSDESNQNNMLQVSVQPGDTVWNIAKQYVPEGTDIREYVYDIMNHNELVGRHLQVGEVIEIPIER